MQEFLSSDYICVFKQGETRRRETQNTEQKEKMTRGRSKKKRTYNRYTPKVLPKVSI